MTAVQSLTPLTLTVPAHGVVNGFSVGFAELGGLDALNAKSWPPSDDDLKQATVVDVDTLQFNTVDAARCGGSFTSGGKIAYLTPVDLSGYAVSFEIFAVSDPTTVVLTEACTVDNVAKTITLDMDVTALAQPDYTYALVAASGGKTILLAFGALSIIDTGTP